MLNIIWLSLILLSILFGAITRKVPDVVNSVAVNAKMAFQLALGLAGLMAFWLGIMKIAERSLLVEHFGKLLHPIMKRLFPDVPSDHPAMGSMIMNITANMLGLNNAATPFGLRAMEELDKLNPHKGTASNAMCTFMAINTSSVQLIPASAIAYLAAAGSENPTSIIITALIATIASTTAAIIAVKTLQRFPFFNKTRLQSNDTISAEFPAL